ncbi:MAG: RecX family transcriptional regulator [Candidatus Acidiferrales bacterium]
MAFRTPKKLGTESELYGAAMRALMRRAHSVHEMRELLERRAERVEDVRPVLDRLKQHRYLDDARFAADYARIHARARRQGRYRIARELRTRGVPDRHIEAALEAAFAETNEVELVRARLKRKLAQFRGPIDERKAASLYRSLLRAGFSSDSIRSELRLARIEAKALATLPDMVEED